MGSGDTPSSRTGPEILDRWTARRVRPIVLLYIVAVFAAFIAVSIFVFHSPEAVKALVLAAVGALVASVPGVTGRVEYRLTETGIEKRTIKEEPDPLVDVVSWHELSRVVPMRHGFKFYKTMDETNALGRFWKNHISDRYSGEVHVETVDLDRVLGHVERLGATVA